MRPPHASQVIRPHFPALLWRTKHPSHTSSTRQLEMKRRKEIKTIKTMLYYRLYPQNPHWSYVKCWFPGTLLRLWTHVTSWWLPCQLAACILGNRPISPLPACLSVQLWTALFVSNTNNDCLQGSVHHLSLHFVSIIALNCKMFMLVKGLK